MAKNALPVTQIPRTFNTVIGSTRKTSEFFLPYDRTGIMNVISALIQNEYVNEYTESAGYGCSSLIKNKYAFECKNILLLEFYDFLRTVPEDFITILRMEMRKNGTAIGFRIDLSRIALTDNDVEWIHKVRAIWNTISMAAGYINHFGYYINADSHSVMFYGYYRTDKKKGRQ